MAACWHFCLTALVFPVHTLWHAFDNHYADIETTVLGDSPLQVSSKHHPDDCQLCKLNNQLQPVSLGKSGRPVDPNVACLAPGGQAYRNDQISDYSSRRAPPAGSQMIFSVV